MDVGDEVDRIMSELRAARLQRSLAGGPGQSALPDVDVSVSPAADGAAAVAGDAGGDEPVDGADAAFVAALRPATGGPVGADNGSAPPGPGVVRPDVVGAEAVGADVVRTEATSVEPFPEGGLEAAPASAAVPEATAPETGGQPTSLDAHALARLEAASDLAESLGLGFHLGGAVERIAYGASEGRAGVESLREASWLIERYIALVEQRPVGAGLHAASVRLGRSGEAIAGLRAISAALEAERPFDTPLPAGQELVVAEPPGESDLALSADDRALSADDLAPSAAVESSQTPETVPDQRSFGVEVALMAVRWSIMVVAVIVIVLALTLIGERF